MTFTGALPFAEVPCYLKAANAFTFASVTETQGLVTMEAMAAGLPIAAVDAIGTQDIVEHGKQGFLTQNDANDLANAIIKLVENPSLMSKFKSASLRTSRTFEKKRLARKMLKVYEQAIEDKKAEKYVTVEEQPTALAVLEKVNA